MTTTKRRTARPAPIPRRLTLDDLTAIDEAIDRILPMHLRACSRVGCVDPVVCVIFDERTSHVERICARHTKIVQAALITADRATKDRVQRERQQDQFDRLDPVMQYALDGR